MQKNILCNNMTQFPYSSQASLKLTKPLPTYESIGEKDIENVLAKFKKDQINKADKFYKDYQALIKQFATNEKIEKWLSNKEKTDPHAYKHFIKLLDKNNEK